MAINVVSAAITTLLPPSHPQQPQFCCYGGIKACPSSFQKSAVEKIFSEEERLFFPPHHKRNHGLCFRMQAVRSDHLNAVRDPDLHAAKSVEIQTVSEKTVIGEGGFSQDVAIPSQHFENQVHVGNQLTKTGYSLEDLRDLYSPNDMNLHVPNGGLIPFAESMSSASETAQIHGVRNWVLVKDVNTSVADTLSDGMYNYLSMPINASSTEHLQPTTEATSIVSDLSISVGDAVVNIPSAASGEGMESLSDSQVSTDSLPSLDSTVNSMSDTVSQSEPTSEPFIESKNIANFSAERTEKSLEEFFSSIQESLTSSVSSASSTMKETYNNINGSILKSTKNLTESFENAISGILSKGNDSGGFTRNNSIDLMSPFEMGTPANNAIKKVVLIIEDSAGSVLAIVVNLVTDVYSFTKALLPPEVQSVLDVGEEKASKIIKLLGYAVQQVNVVITDIEKAVGVNPENPVIPVIVFGGGTIFVGFSFWQYNYGGYSGDLTAKMASELLREEENTVLIDIRPQVLKESDGIPDLRRGARFKFAGVELPEVDGSIKKLLKNANAIDDVLTAAVIKNLKIVNGSTKVIIMDADGLQSRKVARALRKLGIRRSYRIQGGFKSWVGEGLRVKEMKTETPLTILKEETEAILEESRPAPGTIFAACVGFVAAINALIEWEKTLQLIGFIGVVQLIYSRINSYESAEDLKADLRALFSPFQSATQGILWIAGQMEPNKLKLATSPSTTAVQNRVLQAAAKHGSLPSEIEQTQDLEPVSDTDTETEMPNASQQEL